MGRKKLWKNMSIEERIWDLDINEKDRKLMLQILEIAEVVRMYNYDKRDSSIREGVATSSIYTKKSPRGVERRRPRDPRNRQSGAFPARRQSDY